MDFIVRATRIPLEVLIGKRHLADVPIAQRLSWAAPRKTTRVEDLTYSMMDIVHVKIPVAYGEGRYAFIRLQGEALKRDPDQSVFAWGRFLNPLDLPQCPTDSAADSSLGQAGLLCPSSCLHHPRANSRSPSTSFASHKKNFRGCWESPNMTSISLRRSHQHPTGFALVSPY